MTDRVVRIGGACGAWGDSPMGTGQLLQADVQYLMMDYLAEVTMSLLARARLKDPDAGYPPDFVAYLKPHLADIKQRGVRVVSNAGGVNPAACKRALEAAATQLGIPLRVAVVEGDDLMPEIDVLRAAGITDWKSGAPLPSRLLTANAYLGALPVALALECGADIVITGRCADSALALGILMHEFGWAADDYDRLAAGSLVGHLLECGPQATGGTFTDWDQVPDWYNIGYPIAECTHDGSFILTKPAGTGGMVIPACVAEQTLYEIGDPAAYFLPDVTADFSQVRLEQAGADRVRVTGARGRAPTAQYKVSATYQDGMRATAMVSIVGVNAARKASKTAAALLARARMIFQQRGMADFSATHIDLLGAEASYGKQSRALASREVILRLVVEHTDAKALDLFARELGSVGLSCAPGTTGLIGGRPKPAPVIRLFTFFVSKAFLTSIQVQVGDEPARPVTIPIWGGYVEPEPALPHIDAPVAVKESTRSVSLLALAHARSGDKGNSSNIALFSRKPEYLDHLRRVVTPERVAAHFREQVSGTVTRYEAPGLAAFNFVLEDSLGGGGMASMRLDAQGKAYGQRLLEMQIPAPECWGLPEGVLVAGTLLDS